MTDSPHGINSGNSLYINYYVDGGLRMTEWYIDIIYTDSGEVVYNTGPFNSMRKAEKAERGVNINLDHDHYVTRISFKGEIEP